MKRLRNGSASSLVSTSEGEQGFWPSYADMMSAVALILFLVAKSKNKKQYLHLSCYDSRDQSSKSV